MKYTWKNNRNNDLHRYIFTAADIAKGIFGENLFYVLPFIPNGFEYKTVYFPRLKKGLNKFQWNILSKTDVQIPLNIENLFDFSSLEDELINKESTSSLETKMLVLQKEWSYKSKEFEQALSKIFLPMHYDFFSVDIYLVSCGTIGSYYFDDKKNILSIYLRLDAPIVQLAKLIVLGILQKNIFYIDKCFGDLGEYTSGSFSRILTITDFIFLVTPLSGVFPGYVPSKIFNIREGNGTLAKESMDYLSELGFKPKSLLQVTTMGILNTADNTYIKNFNNQETIVLGLFLQNYGKLCSYDLIAEKLYGNSYSEKFSLSLLNKLVHQIRFKLKLNGYSSIVIETKRGEGYILY